MNKEKCSWGKICGELNVQCTCDPKEVIMSLLIKLQEKENELTASIEENQRLTKELEQSQGQVHYYAQRSRRKGGL